MQYKIPVQIENEDPIIFNLSLRQLAIIMWWWGIAYSIFTSLAPTFWWQVWLLFSLPFLLLWILIAVFKYYEMTFVPFLLSAIRYNVNLAERKWVKWVDSFQPIDIWYVTNIENKKENDIDFTNKIEKIKNIDDKINKL